jgi:hypothetical protein
MILPGGFCRRQASSAVIGSQALTSELWAAARARLHGDKRLLAGEQHETATAPL